VAAAYWGLQAGLPMNSGASSASAQARAESPLVVWSVGLEEGNR
jgi:hypothetical protein